MANTLQGLADSPAAAASEAVAESLAEVQDLFAEQEDPPVSCVQLVADPDLYSEVLAFAGALMAKSLKVDISFQRGRDAISGEVQDFLQLEATR